MCRLNGKMFGDPKMVFLPDWPSVGCTFVQFVDKVLDGCRPVGLSRRCFGAVERSERRWLSSSCWLDGNASTRLRALLDILFPYLILDNLFAHSGACWCHLSVLWFAWLLQVV